MGSVVLPAFAVVHHTPMICNLQDSFLWNRMTSNGRCRGLYTLGAGGIGNSRECLTPRRAVSSNYATSPEEINAKGIITQRNIGIWRYPVGEVESRDTYRRSLFVWI